MKMTRSLRIKNRLILKNLEKKGKKSKKLIFFNIFYIYTYINNKIRKMKVIEIFIL